MPCQSRVKGPNIRAGKKKWHCFLRGEKWTVPHWRTSADPSPVIRWWVGSRLTWSGVYLSWNRRWLHHMLLIHPSWTTGSIPEKIHSSRKIEFNLFLSMRWFANKVDVWNTHHRHESSHVGRIWKEMVLLKWTFGIHLMLNCVLGDI